MSIASHVWRLTMALMVGLLVGPACTRAEVKMDTFPDPPRDLDYAEDAGPQKAVLAGGCFWCVEAVFEELDGVSDVTSGYAGDREEVANYKVVSSGQTNHAEAVLITYDPTKITYGQLLKVFFSVAHDPTQLNRQGPDTGRQYRSAVFFETEEQKSVAAAYIEAINKSEAFDEAVATTLEPLDVFFTAEDYHQDYAKENPAQPYIVYQAAPKVEKVRKHFKDQVKKDEEGSRKAEDAGESKQEARE